MRGKVQRVFRTKNVHEISIDYDGNYYLTIFGQHINGWFIAVPNWQKSCEACEPTNTFYNAEKLSECFNKKVAKAIAEAMRDYWITVQEVKDETT